MEELENFKAGDEVDQVRGGRIMKWRRGEMDSRSC